MPRPSKGARLYFREPDGKWYIRDGAILRSTGCDHGDRQRAEAALADYLARKHAPSFGKGDPAQVAVNDVLHLYLTDHGPHTKRPDVIQSAVIHLATFWDGRACADITKGTCRDYVSWRTSQPQARYKDPVVAPRVGDQTARRELEVLSAAIGYAYGENKLRYLIPVHLPDKAEPRERFLTRSEVAQLLWASLGWCWWATDWPSRKPVWRRLRDRDTQSGVSRDTLYTPRSPHVARFVLLGVYTGTRHDAILKLRWVPSTAGGWVDLDRGIVFRKGVREGQSTKKRTPVAVSARLAAHARRWKAQSVSYVVEYGAAPIGKMNRAWKTVRRNAGVTDDVTPHILRHTFASWAVQAGESFDAVADALGTTPQIVRRVYGHLAPEHTRAVVEAVSGGVSGGQSGRRTRMPN